MLVVTGAGGQLGRLVVAHLIEKGLASQLIIGGRDSAKLEIFRAAGVMVSQIDFDNPTSLTDIFNGAERLLLISTNGPDSLRLERHYNAITAAVKA